MPFRRIWRAVAVLSFFAAPALAAVDETDGPQATPAEQEARNQLPADLRAMLEAAAKTEDAAQVAAVAYAASEVYPDYADVIKEYADFLRGFLSPYTGKDIDTIIARLEPVEPKSAPDIKIRTAEQPLEPAPAPKFLQLGDWAGSVTASGSIASGNSSNAAGGINAKAHLERGPITHNVTGYFDYGRSKGVKTQQRWGAAYKLDYSLGDDTFGYGRVSYDEDEFSGFDYRLFAGFGVGHWLMRSERLALKLEGGPGYQYAPIDDNRDVDSHAAVYMATEFSWVIRNGLKFEQNFNATWTNPTTTLISTTTLTNAFSDTLSTGLSYMRRYETNPPDGRLKTDTVFRANLTYGF